MLIEIVRQIYNSATRTDQAWQLVNFVKSVNTASMVLTEHVEKTFQSKKKNVYLWEVFAYLYLTMVSLLYYFDMLCCCLVNE